jgi:hypothetical protein
VAPHEFCTGGGGLGGSDAVFEGWVNARLEAALRRHWRKNASDVDSVV